MAEALRICGQCPVREACLDYALKNQIQHGVWGGLGLAARQEVAAGRRARPTGYEDAAVRAGRPPGAKNKPRSWVKGVSWSKRDQRWEVKLMTNGVMEYLGHYADRIAAENAARSHRQEMAA